MLDAGVRVGARASGPQHRRTVLDAGAHAGSFVSGLHRIDLSFHNVMDQL